jgi:predicted dehydrogenase
MLFTIVDSFGLRRRENEMDTVRWGLLSTARINRRVIPGMHATQRGTLAAVASRNLEKAQAYAAEWEIPRVFGSYEEMLTSDEIDAVYISLPNHLHAEWTVRALEAGKHVLCEKPIALSVEEVDRMTQASLRTGRVLAEAFMYRHHPQTKLVGEWVRSGWLGDISLVRSAFSFFMQNREGNVRLSPDLGGGALWDVGIYPVSFAQFVFGRLPESVSGQQWMGETGVDESFAGQLHYNQGGTAQISGSFRIPFYTLTEVHGTKGRLTLTKPYTGINESDSEIVLTPSEGDPQKLRVNPLDPYQAEVEDMQAAILDGTRPLISLDESRNHIKTASALYQAARSQQMVKMS